MPRRVSAVTTRTRSQHPDEQWDAAAQSPRFQPAAPSQTITRRVHESLRFVTLTPMTVPGKGGRPRKWRSDADRVRAFRARERGDDEPPTIDVSVGVRRRSRSRLGPGPPTRRHHRRTQSRTRDDQGRPTTSREGTRARASPRQLDQRRQRPPPSRTRRRRAQPSRPAGTT